MRQIQKRNEPEDLRHWRSAYQGDINFSYDLIDAHLRGMILQSLVSEQGGICAYTGRWIDNASCHIEHLRPQAHCTKGVEDVSYANMVACVPAPNMPNLPYGAHKKKSWPGPTEEAQFVSPLGAGCEQRFEFTLKGEVKASTSADIAASVTIERLGLNHPQLQGLRKAAIDATLRIYGRTPASLSLKEARMRFRSLLALEQSGGQLEPFCYVLKQALLKHITRVQAIQRSKREQ